MKVIGLTGGIASGKSTVSRFLAQEGAFIIDADKIAHQIYEEDTDLVQNIAGLFGKEILIPSTSLIDRNKLGKIVFENPVKMKQLENLVHPVIRKKILAETHKAGSKGYHLCIVDAALLVETGFYKYYDGLIVVKALPKEQRERLKLRNEFSDEEIEKRIQAQAPLEEKLKVATWIIDNSGNLQDTQKQVKELYKNFV